MDLVLYNRTNVLSLEQVGNACLGRLKIISQAIIGCSEGCQWTTVRRS